MDNRLKNIMDNYDSMKIGLDDTFRFHCTACGKCCINREDILLNPHDVFRLAKELQKEPYEVVEEYCDTYLGETSRVVLIRIIHRGSIKKCPFLKEQKCSVHKGKPTVCALYPLGRGLKAATDGMTDIEHREVQYFLQAPDCGDASDTFTVRQWLSDFDLLSEEAFFKKWMQIAMDCGAVVKKVEKLCSDEVLNKLAFAILCAMYLDYRTDEPFMPQFEQNERKLRELFSNLPIK